MTDIPPADSIRVSLLAKGCEKVKARDDQKERGQDSLHRSQTCLNCLDCKIGHYTSLSLPPLPHGLSSTLLRSENEVPGAHGR